MFLTNNNFTIIKILTMPNILTIMGSEVKTMPDYKKMYLTLAQETEKAINILIDAQRKCEQMYIDSPETEIKLLNPPQDK